MFKKIKFNNPAFSNIDEANVLDEMTSNTIIFCATAEVKNVIALDILNTSKLHTCETETDAGSEAAVSIVSAYLPTTRLLVDGKQFITVTTEAPFAFMAKAIGDVWFATVEDSKIELFPLRMYEDKCKYWTPDRNELYKGIAGGSFGRVCSEAWEILVKTPRYSRMINKSLGNGFRK